MPRGKSNGSTNGSRPESKMAAARQVLERNPAASAAEISAALRTEFGMDLSPKAASSYRYSILNRAVPDPFLAETTWHVAHPLDLRAMRLACDPLYGEHDFASFCRRTEGSSLVRRVRFADWSDLGDGLLRFDIEASSFCQQMVRSLVGTMIEIGLGKRRAGDMAEVLRARDRQMAGEVAPAHGLCLWEVTYEQ